MELYVLPRFWRPDPSADHDDESVRRAREVLTSSIASFLDPDRLIALAEDLRCVARNRKHHAGLMVIAAILSALRHGPDTEGRWLDAQSLYERLGGRRGGATAFRDKLRDLEPVFRELLRRRVLSLQENNPALRGRLSAFADVLIPDGCAFKIAAALAGIWPGTGTPAEFKLHAVYSVRAGGLADLRGSAGSVHDNKGFGLAPWVRDALYIWDLGYQDYDRFVDAVLSGAVPLQRLKDKANPVVVASYGTDGVRRPLLDGEGQSMRLNAACELGLLAVDGTIDLDVKIHDSRGRVVVARVVCVPFRDDDRWYLTTLTREVFTPFDVAEIYRVRWEVELFFRDLKGAVRLDEVSRLKNPISLRVALFASLIAATLGQQLTTALHALQEPESESQPPVLPPLDRVSDATESAPEREEPVASVAGFSPLCVANAGTRVRRKRTG